MPKHEDPVDPAGRSADPGAVRANDRSPAPPPGRVPPTVTERLCEFAARLDWTALPAPVRRTTVLALIDHVACAAGGARTDWGGMARRAALRWPEGGDASILGEHATYAPATAAFLHGHYGNMLDFDDTLYDLGHPGTCVIPAALAVGEQEDRHGHEFLAAVAAGYEVAGRFGMAGRPGDAAFRRQIPTGWHAVGAAVAAARLLRLDGEGIRRALGIVAELASVAVPLTTDTTYAFKSGKLGTLAATGVRAAYLAAEGLHGKRDPLDEATPYWRSFGSDRYDPTAALAGLGDRYVLQDLSFKPYPSCRFTHTAVEAAVALRDELDLSGTDLIDEVRVSTFTRALQLDEASPDNAAMGPFCFPYVVAVACLGVPFEDWYAPATRASPGVERLAARVRLEASAEFDAITDRTAELPCQVTIALTDGRSASRRIVEGRGGPRRPLPAAEIEAKFRTFVPPVLGSGGADELLRALRDLEGDGARASTVRAVAGRLRPNEHITNPATKES